MDTTKWKIVQIVPAEHWNAFYREGKKETVERVTCWALVADGERTFVTGIVMAGLTPEIGQFALEIPNFVNYRHVRGME